MAVHQRRPWHITQDGNLGPFPILPQERSRGLYGIWVSETSTGLPSLMSPLAPERLPPEGLPPERLPSERLPSEVMPLPFFPAASTLASGGGRPSRFRPLRTSKLAVDSPELSSLTMTK